MEKWTAAQRKAIDANGSTLVTASAGTGKTAVLTEKVASLFLHSNVSINNLLVMTFSNAAAEEMKERIANKLVEMAKDKTVPLNKRRHLFAQIRMIHTANIKTIHAFCNDIIKKYYYIVGLNPNVEVGSNFDIAILKRKAITKVLEEEYRKKDDIFVQLVEYFDSSEAIEDIFINAHEKVFNTIDPLAWLKNAVELYNVDTTVIPDYMQEKLIADFEKALENYKEAKFEIDMAEDEKLTKAAAIIDNDIRIITKMINALKAKDINAFNGTLSCFGETIRFNAAYSYIRNLRNKGKDIVDRYKKSNFNIPDQIERIKFMYSIVQKFADIIMQFDAIYKHLKQNENIIDFSDMEQYANKILDDKTISMLYKSTFKYVFVDEYQDTSPIQESIIGKISGTNNLFCVGDQKQSIYRFRSSEPELFINRDKAYREKHLPGQVIALNNNFRSNKNVLDCANDVFSHICKQSKEITYDKDAVLVHGRNDGDDIVPVQVSLIPETIKADFGNLSMDEIEAFNLVDIINKKLQEKVYDPELGDYRQVKYGDIVILCRKLTGISDYISRIFTDNKIPFIVEKSGGLFATVEIQNLIHIMELSNNVNNDIAIISFIHEGFLGFTDDDLVEIRKYNFNDSISHNIIKLAEEDSDIGLKCKKFINFFKSIKNIERYNTLSEVINYIISELNYMDFYAVQNNGKQRIANIKLFQQHAFNYSQKHNDKIFGFLNYIKDLINTNIIIDEAKVNYDENSVKITTIHKSKGLEYPIVILPFMGKAFNNIDKRINVNIERSIGIGFKYFNLEKEERGKTFIRTLIEDVISDKNKEEEMRLLYVAMTRAKEELIIQGSMSGTKTTATLEDASCMLDWIMSTIVAESEDPVCEASEMPTRLNGNWQLEIVKSENLEEYIDKKIEPVPDEVFLGRYAMPSTPAEPEPVNLVDRNIPTTISASKILQEQENPLKVPAFKAHENSANIGTATHDFLKYLDFSKDVSYFGLLDQREEIIEKGFMREEDASLVDLIKLEKFFQTDLAKMIRTADRVEKERSLSVIEKADNIGFYSMDTKEVLVRCIIDLMFEKDGNWYLVDYKTDKIDDPDDNNEITNKILHHRTQLSFYEKAIKEILGITIKDSYIVFLDIGETFRIFKY